MKQLLFFLLFFSAARLQAQRLSIATDLSLLRQYSPGQRFWAIGQTVQVQRGAGPRDAFYAWISYYTNGKVRNRTTAYGRTPFVSPGTVDYTVTSALRYRQVSLGRKHYFTGSYTGVETGIYAYGGFGLLLARADNTFDRPVNAAAYRVLPPFAGSQPFRKLTFDSGIGAEVPLGIDLYLYGELRSWFPLSSYPSPYLYRNEGLPSVLAANAGMRILFD